MDGSSSSLNQSSLVRHSEHISHQSSIVKAASCLVRTGLIQTDHSSSSWNQSSLVWFTEFPLTTRLHNSCLCCLPIKVHHSKEIWWDMGCSYALIHPVNVEVEVTITFPHDANSIPLLNLKHRFIKLCNKLDKEYALIICLITLVSSKASPKIAHPCSWAHGSPLLCWACRGQAIKRTKPKLGQNQRSKLWSEECGSWHLCPWARHLTIIDSYFRWDVKL